MPVITVVSWGAKDSLTLLVVAVAQPQKAISKEHNSKRLLQKSINPLTLALSRQGRGLINKPLP